MNSRRDHYFPNTEPLAADEMRIISLGTGRPFVRRAQANCSWLIELGNGDKFIMDFGSGSQANFTALEIPHQDITAYFATHLHTDHVGDFAQVWVGSWVGGRVKPLIVYGPSGPEVKYGIAHFVRCQMESFAWDKDTRLGTLAGANRRSPFIVYYITNGQRVAHQNRDRLVEFADPDVQKAAISKADRLNVIPLSPVPKTPVAVYSLTPGTSFPGKTTRLHAGKKEERAFLTALLGRAYPHVVRRFPENTMRRNVTSDWEGLVRRYRTPAADLPRAFVRAFKAALIAEFGAPIKVSLPNEAKREKPGRFVGRLRRALAHTVLIDRPPDLVILDEFQRYRDILSKENRSDPLNRREFEDLVTVAMSSPGVVTGRALLRHFPDALSPEHFAETVGLAWHGLRLYLDKPVFWARLQKGKPVRVLQHACLDGNLEAVLDEHFWMRRPSLPTREQGLANDLREALGVTTGAFLMHSVNKERLPKIRIRCHAAVPFGSTDDEDRPARSATDEQPPRSDEIRNAFNSPFWPHVLATTSVGQEGLDFHTWCSRILHWDLCPSPIELEQREGRIQRFAGLAVRRRLQQLEQGGLLEQAAPAKHSSLWKRVETLANEKYLNRSGLSPWWVLDGAAVSRFVFNLPQSRDLEKFKLLREQRLIYRLALGQPNQEDLVDFLSKHGSGLTDILRRLALDLSSFARTQASGDTMLEATEPARAAE